MSALDENIVGQMGNGLMGNIMLNKFTHYLIRCRTNRICNFAHSCSLYFTLESRIVYHDQNSMIVEDAAFNDLFI